MAENRDSNIGPLPPYGTAIREAMRGGDPAQLRKAVEAGRQWLEKNPGHPKHGEVQAVLREMEGAQNS